MFTTTDSCDPASVRCGARVLHWVSVVQADDTSAEMTEHVWDAAGMLGGARESRSAVAQSPLLPLMCAAALGRGVPQPVRVAAMHALAACAGAEEIGNDFDMLRAVLCDQVRLCRASMAGWCMKVC